MNETPNFLTKLGGLGAATYIRHWMGSLDIQGAWYDRSVDPSHPSFQGPVIVLCWHEYILPMIYLRGRTNSAILTSRHRDADILSEAARHLGFTTIRGSTARGGSRALLKLLRHCQHSNLGSAGDGPRGPRRVMAPGAIYLSSRLQVPIVAYGIGFDRPIRMPTWDRFAIPRLGSRARMITSPRLQVPPDLDRQGLEHYRQHVESVLMRLTLEAEAWAEAGSRKVGQAVLRPEPAAQAYRRLAPKKKRTRLVEASRVAGPRARAA